MRFVVIDSSTRSVQLHCVYGYDVQTFDSLHYDVAKLDPYMPAPTVRWGDGDGTVVKTQLCSACLCLILLVGE